MPRALANAPPDLGLTFLNVAREAGLNAKTIFGGEHKNKYLLETTGCGVAFYDYDNDGWLDIFIVNGTRLEGFPARQEPTNHLFTNNRDGTFTDVTAKAGLLHSGWGQGVCVGDYDNDGFDDLFVTYFGKNVLYHNNGDGTFNDVSAKAGVAGNGKRWNTGCSFVDYDRDGRLDLFVANYIDLDLATAPVPESGPCLYKGVMVACGPPGLPGGKNILYHNNGGANFEDATYPAGLGAHTHYLGCGGGFFDMDNDGWPDILICNGHVYPEVEQLKTEAGYPQQKLLYKNLRNGRFADVSSQAGTGITVPVASRGCAFGDFDNDGDL